MKKLLIPIGTLFVMGFSHAQLTQTENYVYSKTYLSDPSLPSPKTSEIVQYFDGLGRPKQVVNVKASPLGRDVVSHIEYDGFGRQALDYLPVPQGGTGNGAIVTNPLVNATQTDIYGSEIIFAKKEFDNSPLDRVMEQKQVGTAWSSKPIKFEYDANIDEEVKKYVATYDYDLLKSKIDIAGSYGSNQLYKNTVIDEDLNKTIEFKNGQGQTILVRKMLDGTNSADTYYVYNDYNQLAYVIPPLAVAANNVDPSTTLDNLCYQYIYDSKNRLVEKKLPGKDWEYMVYDKQDRLVATRDANLEANGQWLFTKYDKFSRVAFTGISTGGMRTTEQAEMEWYEGNMFRNESVGFSRDGMDVYYSGRAYPADSKYVKLLSVNYYDTYASYGFNPFFPTTIFTVPIINDNSASNNVSTKSLPVMSFVKNIEDDNWTKNYTWYDTKGRAIGSYSINHLGGYTQTESQLDFTGTPLLAVTKHKRLDSDTEKVITETFTYDDQNRLKVHKHKVDNNPEEILAQNDYNELSQLQQKIVGDGLQTINYTYNIRGWMTKINDPANLGNDLFGYKIKYNQVEGLQTPDALDGTLKVLPKFNGNIAEVDWKTATNPNDNLRRYGYVYDGLNRLKAGFYQNEVNPGATEYFEKVTYDLNGNIISLKRSEGILLGSATAMTIDNLDYNYTGNILNTVTDLSGQYNGYPDTSGNPISYDLNGNMTTHKDKGILEINYNILNLPSKITFYAGLYLRNGIIRNNTTHTYRADGMKLIKTYKFAPYNPLDTASQLSTEITEYLDGFQYKTEPLSMGGPRPGGTTLTTVLQFLPTSEGYFDFVKNKYIYNYADHLGNVRLSYFNNGSSIEVLEENNYYPFGLKHEGYNPLVGNPSYNYKYNGKELQETGMYDYGARFYMPDIGRWGVVDPLAEQYRRHSTYNYAVNNPIRFIDPDGRGVEDFVKRKDNSIYWDNKANDQATTKAGETYLGKNLSFTFNSYIGNNYDGPLGSLPEGDKLTTTINLSASENSSGELTGLSATKTTEMGKTFGLFEGRDFYPGEGGSNNSFTKSGMSINYEQHASVPKFEESGLNSMGFKIVDVSQKLNISFDKGSGNLSVNAYTNIFPSATLKLNNTGTTLMNYKQPSFVGTHTAPITGYSPPAMGEGRTGGQPIRDFSYYPSRFYKRN